MSDTARDLDETRRLCYIAKIAIRAGRPISPELAGTLANAIAHHSEMVNPVYAEQFGVSLVGKFRPEASLEILDTIITKCASSS